MGTLSPVTSERLCVTHVRVGQRRGEERSILTIPRVFVPDISPPYDKVIIAQHADETRVGKG